MNAIVFKGKCHVEVDRVPQPELEVATDAIVRIVLCGLCGSDLHPFHCREQVSSNLCSRSLRKVLNATVFLELQYNGYHDCC